VDLSQLVCLNCLVKRMVSRVLVVTTVLVAGGAGLADCSVVVRAMERVLELVRVLGVESALRCPVSLVREFRCKFVMLNYGEGEEEDVLTARLVSILVKIL